MIMRITGYDHKLGELRLILENLEDLWHLEKVLEPTDIIEGSTMRSVRINNREEKKHVTIAIALEQVEFSKSLNRLRMLGKIVSGSPEEFVQLGRYHTIEVEPQDKLKIRKSWKQYQLTRLKQAEKETKKPRLRIIVLDDEKALTAIVRGYGVEYGPEFHFTGSKRDDNYEERTKEYFGKLASEIEKHEERYVIAGPGFTKDNLRKYVQEKTPSLLKKISFESCSYAERSGINELFKNGVIERLIGEDRLAQELELIEQVIIEIHKGSGRAEYGLDAVKKAVNAYAAEIILVLDEYLRTVNEVEEVIEIAEKNKAKIVIFSSESDGGMKLKGIGRVAALLKFKIRET